MRYPKIPHPKEPRGRVRYLSAQERDTLLDACRAEDQDFYALVVCALCTGARAGELLGLTWRDVDLGRSRASLHRTKNDERRALSLPGPALAILRERSKVRRIGTDRVFPHPTVRGRPYDYAKPFRTAMEAAGIENFRFHDLRHTAASYCAMGGATTAELAAILGHKTLQMVQRYSHLSDQHVASVVERMTGQIFCDGKAQPRAEIRSRGLEKMLARATELDKPLTAEQLSLGKRGLSTEMRTCGMWSMSTPRRPPSRSTIQAAPFNDEHILAELAWLSPSAVRH